MTGKVSPSQGGCWYCHTEAAPMLFSVEWDAYVHAECIKRALEKDPDDEEARVFAEEFDITNPRRAALDKEFFRAIIDEWKTVWMNQRQNSEADYQNYFRRALGVDANMEHSLARMLEEAAEPREKLIAEKDAEIERLKACLSSIVARTHSWVIERETAYIIRPLMDGIRELAREALAPKKGPESGT